MDHYRIDYWPEQHRCKACDGTGSLIHVRVTDLRDGSIEHGVCGPRSVDRFKNELIEYMERDFEVA